MKRIPGDEKQTGLSKTWLFVVFGFGAAAFLVRWAGLTIPTIGTVIIDPREIFVTLGAAFTGPVGGLVIGSLSGLPALSVALGSSSLMAHSVSGLLIGLLYKPVYKRWPMPALLLGWAVLIAAYYYIFLIPTFLAAISLADPGGISGVLGEDLSFSQAYSTLGQGAFPEAVATFIVTAIILIALPERYRRPLW
jgi:LytS/YehU family sensor histidine kinase